MKGEKDERKENRSVDDADQVTYVPPDGGWGWVIVAGGFFSMVFSSLSVFGFGILFSPFLSRFDTSATKIAWIFGTRSIVWSLHSILVGPLCEEFGWRKTALVGGFINFLSIFLSSFSPNPNFLFFSFSILGGIGGCIGGTITFVVISRYFKKHLAFAMGIGTLGVCTSAFISPLLADYLLNQYGYKGASMVFSSVVLNQCVAACLFQPVEWHMKPERKEHNKEVKPKGDDVDHTEIPKGVKPQVFQSEQDENGEPNELSTFSSESPDELTPSIRNGEHTSKLTEDLDLSENKNSLRVKMITFRIMKSTLENMKTLRFKRVVILAVSASCLMMVYINFIMWIPFVVMSIGYSRHMAAWCVSAASVANASGRICIALLSEWNKFNIRIVYQCAIFFIGSFVIAFSLVQDFKFLVMFSCCWGFSVGAAFSINPTVMIDVMGVRLFPAVFGMCSWMNALLWIVLAPSVGYIRDATSSYAYGLWLMGALNIFAVLLWRLMPLATKYDAKTIKLKTEELS